MRSETFTEIFRLGNKQTKTTTFYKDGKKRAILCITTTREDWKPLL